MSPIDLLVLDLVRIAESPVYSAYRWLGRELGRPLALAEFLIMIDRLVRSDVLRLWQVDAVTSERTRLARVPVDLAQRYDETADLDARFDPFGLSLTLGDGAESDETPEWAIDLDFEEGAFQLRVAPAQLEGVLTQLERLYPELNFTTVKTEPTTNGLHVTGGIRHRSGAGRLERPTTDHE